MVTADEQLEQEPKPGAIKHIDEEEGEPDQKEKVKKKASERIKPDKRETD